MGSTARNQHIREQIVTAAAAAPSGTANGQRTIVSPVPPRIRETEPAPWADEALAAIDELPLPPAWAAQLRQWWIDLADQDIAGSMAKIVEYGGSGTAYDLLATGHDLAAMNGRHVTDEEAGELAILFYLSSKVNRWMAAAMDGRRPSDDTLLDIVYYGMMARRNRAVGGWPVAA